MNPWIGLLMVLGILTVLIGGIKVLQRKFHFHPELARKAVHIGMGLVTLSFPWLFDSSWPVLLLGGLAILMLVCIRWIAPVRKLLGSVMGDVERDSWGEVYFPVSVALVFYWSGHNPVFYLIPILILTLADGLGALTGVRYGLSCYSTDEGQKSAEGSLAFFITAFLSTHVPLLLMTDIGRAESLLIALTLAFLVMLAEASSWEGLDNLFVPLLSYLLLTIYVELSVVALVFRFLAAAMLTLFVLVWRKNTSLSHSAAIGAAFFGYVIWALAGWKWLVAPVVFFLLYAWIVPLLGKKTVPGNIHAVIRVVGGPLIYLTIALRTQSMANSLPIFYLCFACHLANICVSRLYRTDGGFLKPWLASTLIAWTVIMVPFMAISFSRQNGIVAIFGFVSVLGSCWIFLKTIRHSRMDVDPLILWLREGVLAPLVAAIGFLPNVLEIL